MPHSGAHWAFQIWSELILKLNAAGTLVRLTFITKSERVRKRLSQISGIREVAIYVKPDQHGARQPVTKVKHHHQGEYEPCSKKALA